jgi:hypothetical protein
VAGDNGLRVRTAPADTGAVMEALVVQPTAAGTVLAAAAIAAGAPLFSAGLRALRLRRHFRGLRESALAALPTGISRVRGRVALESPMFAPLSGRPCAGFRLEVTGERSPVPRSVEVKRTFRLTDGGVSARVEGAAARWDLEPSGERTVGPEEPLTEHLAVLLARIPEARWMRRAGMSMRLVERALVAGGECHVVGFARHQRTVERQAELSIARTGTGEVVIVDAAEAAASPEPAHDDPDLWLGPGDHLDFLLVSDRPPRPEHIRVGALRLLALVLGPALSLAGMLYLAHTAEWLRTHGGF